MDSAIGVEFSQMYMQMYLKQHVFAIEAEWMLSWNSGMNSIRTASKHSVRED